MDEQAYKLSLLGHTEAEMARFFDVSRNTFHRWKAENPGFRDAVHSGKEIADAEVSLALYKRAAGMTIKSERAMKNKQGEIVVTQTLTEIPPDTKAAIHWLQVRRRHDWSATSGGGGEDKNECPKCAATAALSDEELKARIEVLQKRRQFDLKTKPP
ncbi:hypothetical protein [Mameliella alba]|nr:hypothetical protein [Mameliella alba]OWV49689.1 terminase [Mameliella alba]